LLSSQTAGIGHTVLQGQGVPIRNSMIKSIAATAFLRAKLELRHALPFRTWGVFEPKLPKIKSPPSM
jgi:hypothetical protein